MKHYLLQPRGAPDPDVYPAEEPARRVWVEDGDWLEARFKAFGHAMQRGERHIVIQCAGTDIYHRPHWNGKGPKTTAHACNETQTHNLWTFMAAQLRRYAHVYVRPMEECLMWPRPEPVYRNAPTIPMVAGYDLEAVVKVSHDEALGLDLCAAGYDSYAIQDFFYYTRGPKDILKEVGDHRAWERAYCEHIKELL